MSIIDKALEANRNYAKNYNPALGNIPPQNRGCNLHGSTALRPARTIGSAASRYRRHTNRWTGGH